MTVTPIELFASPVHLHPDGRVRADHDADPHLDGDGWLLMVARVETDADVHGDHWEIHPEADEYVSCLTGAIRLVLRPQDPADQEEHIELTAGTAVVVPRGRWHRLAVETPGYMMAVTLPRGTHEEKCNGT